MDQRLDGLQSEMEKKIDNLNYSISRPAQQLVHQEEENLEEECLTDTNLGEQAQLQPQEELKEEPAEAYKEMQDAPQLCVVCGPWEKKNETSPILTEEGSGKEAVDEPKELISKPFPLELNPTATAQATKSPLPIAPSTDQVYILPSTATQPTLRAPTGNATSIALPILQKFKKLVATVQVSATTSKTQAAAYISWHSGWFGCRIGFGAPEPRHF